MGYSLIYTPVLHFDDINGRPLVGGKLYTYKAGTSAPAPTYRNSSGTELNENPISLNERGECVVWLNDKQSYKFVLKDALENTIWEQDNVSIPAGEGGGGGSTVSITPTISSGTKIADYSIDGVEGELFAPNGGGDSEKRVGFVDTNGNIAHTVTDGEVLSGYCFETEKIAFTETNSHPFVAVFISFNDFWKKTKYSSIDIYASYEWVDAEYEIHLFKIDGTAISNNYFKDFEVFGQVSLPANKYLKLKIKWNLNGNASAGDNLLIKGNIMVASTSLLQSLV